MANIKIRRQHGLGRDLARRKVEEIANSLQEKLNAKWSWSGDTLNFKRSGASGSVDVGDDYVEFNIQLGMLFTPMKGSVENAILKKLDQTLG